MQSKWPIILLVLVFGIQLSVPIKMILDREKVLVTGEVYQFKVTPIDPNDPFRGKSVVLNIAENEIQIDTAEIWVAGEVIYVSIENGADGLAFPARVSKNPPLAESNYVKARIAYLSQQETRSLIIQYPFEEYYMEETKAPIAERLLATDSVDMRVWVSILKGEAVVSALMVDEMAIEEWIDAHNVEVNLQNR